MKVILLVLGGIPFIWISQYANVLWGKWHDEGSDPFFFPAGFALAAIYGWCSKNYPCTFLVGFFSMPYLIPFPPFQSGSAIYNLFWFIFSPANHNLLDSIIIPDFGATAGLFGMGFVKFAKWRNKTRSLS
jgi:hypothetical protein